MTERASLEPDDFEIESFQAADGTPGVQLVIPDAEGAPSFELRMTPAAALTLSARLGSAAVAGETFRVAGKAVPGPHDVRMLAGIIGGALEVLLAPQLGDSSAEDGKKGT